MAEEISITQELIRGSATVLSVVIGAKLALRSYRSNQWWDSRHKTYERVVDLLDRLMNAAVENRICVDWVNSNEHADETMIAHCLPPPEIMKA